MEYLIRTFTHEGETVLDNCMGSGTTGVASANTGRQFIGMELDGRYFEIASDRIRSAIPAPANDNAAKADETQQVLPLSSYESRHNYRQWPSAVSVRPDTVGITSFCHNPL
ncbi:MAG: site-specific DNA-methyltransferase [Bosea sp.]|nr:site-specific DNA-methyltransferase [Bosea sp. (in: a-proteobacteria)]